MTVQIDEGDLLHAVSQARSAIVEALAFVHEHPELAYEEHECSAYLVAQLARGGLDVQRGLGDMPTGFSAVLEGSRPGPTVGCVVVYDAVAVPRSDGGFDAVHSCGHGPIAGGVLGAALGLASLRSELPGRFIVYGCPADEMASPAAADRCGGKTRSVEAGVWDEVDTALYAHPEAVDAVWQGSPYARRDRATILEDCDLATALEVVEGVVVERTIVSVDEKGRTVTEATVRLSAENAAGIADRGERARRALPQARWRAGFLVEPVRADSRIEAAVADAFAALGRKFEADPPRLPFSNDFGNVSQRVPAALIGIGRPGGWALHSDEGARQFASDAGRDCAQTIAAVLALVTSRLMASWR